MKDPGVSRNGSLLREFWSTELEHDSDTFDLDYVFFLGPLHFSPPHSSQHPCEQLVSSPHYRQRSWAPERPRCGLKVTPFVTQGTWIRVCVREVWEVVQSHTPVRAKGKLCKPLLFVSASVECHPSQRKNLFGDCWKHASSVRGTRKSVW